MKKVIVSLILTLIAGVALYLFFTRSQTSSPESANIPNSVTTPVSSPSPAPIPLADGWETVSLQNFSFSYPSSFEYTLNPDNYHNLVFIGPTQTQGTEVYDGIIINLDQGTFSGDFLEFVESQRQNQLDPAVAQVSAVAPFSLNDKSGYQFVVEGLGTFEQIYLSQDNQYIHISRLISDPGNLGFLQISNAIVDSIEFIR